MKLNLEQSIKNLDGESLKKMKVNKESQEAETEDI